jgi:hypothetical protein
MHLYDYSRETKPLDGVWQLIPESTAGQGNQDATGDSLFEGRGITEFDIERETSSITTSTMGCRVTFPEVFAPGSQPSSGTRADPGTPDASITRRLGADVPEIRRHVENHGENMSIEQA